MARTLTIFRGISSSNSAGPAMVSMMVEGRCQPSSALIDFRACNVAPVFPSLQLPAYTGSISTTTWTPGIILGTSASTSQQGFSTTDENQFTLGFTLVTGYGYVVPGDGWYRNVALTGGSGTGRRANIYIDAGSTRVFLCLITVAGSGYGLSDVLSATTASLGGGAGSGFTIQKQFYKRHRIRPRKLCGCAAYGRQRHRCEGRFFSQL